MSPKKQKQLLHQLIVSIHLVMQTLDDLDVQPQAKETADKSLSPAMKYAEDMLNEMFDASSDDLANTKYLNDLTKKVETIIRKNFVG